MASSDKKTPAREKTDSELIHRFKSHPFIFIGTILILVIVVVAFVFLPAIVPEYRRGGNVDLTFGHYDEVPITYVPGNYFAQYYDMVSRYRQNTTNSEYYSFMGYQIWREAFEAAAIHTAMLHEMKQSGYAVPAKVVDRDVARLPYFQENGRFSPALYRQMDNNRRLSLWRQIQDEITKNRFISDVTGLLQPEAEAEFIGKMASVERNFEMAVFPVDSFPETEYAAYARERADLFRSAHLSMLTISSSEREAKQILASIKNGETTFEDAARTHSKDMYAERGGDMGIKMVHELTADIPDESSRETALSLARGEYSDVIKNDASWFFFRCEDAVQHADISDSAVLDKVRSYMRNFDRGRMEDWAIGQANDFIALVEDLGFEEALIEQNMTSRSFGPVPVNYGNIELFSTLASHSVSELSNSASDEYFWRAAFTTPVNVPSQPLVQGSNVLVLLPTAETQAEESSLEGIASTYSAYWLSYISEQSLQQYFLNSPKMEDKFMDVYFRYFMNTGE